MKNLTRTFTTVLCVAASGMYAISAAAQPVPATPAQTHSSGSAAVKQPMSAAMEGMQKMPMSGDTDKDFAMMMKMHHQQAVEMAQKELVTGKSPEMKAMAKKIIAAQKKEIGEFDRWLAKQK